MSENNVNNKEGSSWDSFLTETPSPDETYIQPNIEIKLSKEKRQECRDIVREIKSFGVNQRQILYLVYLLSLELEDVQTVKAISRVIGDNRERTPVEDDIATESSGILILPSTTK